MDTPATALKLGILREKFCGLRCCSDSFPICNWGGGGHLRTPIAVNMHFFIFFRFLFGVFCLFLFLFLIVVFY